MRPEKDNNNLVPAAASPLFLGESERTMDAQGRIQLPPHWLASGQQHLIATPGILDSNVISFFLPDSIDAMFEKLDEGDFTSDKLKPLAKSGMQMRHISVDNNGRLSLTDPEFRSILGADGKAKQVKLVGCIRYFSICDPEKWGTVKGYL